MSIGEANQTEPTKQRAPKRPYASLELFIRSASDNRELGIAQRIGTARKHPKLDRRLAAVPAAAFGDLVYQTSDDSEFRID